LAGRQLARFFRITSPSAPPRPIARRGALSVISTELRIAVILPQHNYPAIRPTPPFWAKHPPQRASPVITLPHPRPRPPSDFFLCIFLSAAGHLTVILPRSPRGKSTDRLNARLKYEHKTKAPAPPPTPSPVHQGTDAPCSAPTKRNHRCNKANRRTPPDPVPKIMFRTTFNVAS